jgi:hypothetical protein
MADVLTELDGYFKIEKLPAGLYQLTVEIVGFQKSVKNGIDSSEESSRNLAVRLEPLPRPPSPSLPRQASRKEEPQQTQSTEAPTFQTPEITNLPGLNQYQDDLTSQAGEMSASISRQDSMLFISGNSANLDAGSFSDPGFRDQMMNAARQMGFGIMEFNPGGEGGREGGGGSPGFGGFGSAGGGPGGAAGIMGGGPGGSGGGTPTAPA